MPQKVILHLFDMALGDVGYLKSADVEAYDGRGDAACTADQFEAMRFDDAIHAITFWKMQSKTRPYRLDGKPNRPLTTFSAEIVYIDVPAQGDPLEGQAASGPDRPRARSGLH
jgi:hypothetical protein